MATSTLKKAAAAVTGLGAAKATKKALGNGTAKAAGLFSSKKKNRGSIKKMLGWGLVAGALTLLGKKTVTSSDGSIDLTDDGDTAASDTPDTSDTADTSA